ncbi:MAG: hypothetical protein HKL80_03250, partial [Acidimicrobiales bacterium]|nr:hypothetical protein [Acidimicrobiales bacterium]
MGNSRTFLLGATLCNFYCSNYHRRSGLVDTWGNFSVAEGGATSLEAGDLSGDVPSNYNRFLKSLSSGVGATTIICLSDKSYHFSSDVPATNIPGTHATFAKVVGPDGATM